MRNSINIRSTLSLSQGTLYCILYICYLGQVFVKCEGRVPVFDNELLAMYVLSERELSPSLHTFWKYVVATVNP